MFFYKKLKMVLGFFNDLSTDFLLDVKWYLIDLD